ncbi:hypothetical protein ART_2007 [Arthrobacter sp. PAMC 25486]|uniref:hypothetical protein n=1 Tax=Arthrobacter sp. PAMC 25486 TaxID=1494608 RepID=UPI000535F14B|nr:hypothetical protein [Arthrobacter sp. PAMC 25486]AIY01606.1 hypothetical protein ART_2007 [Arthrobacter sp. PAMC 25486]
MDGRYTPPVNEYRRQTGRFEIADPRSEPSFDNHFVRGAQFSARQAFDGLADGQTIELELVPEPGNPFDGYAVALHASTVRIGYLASALAKPWQDIVVAYNHRGQAVFATGIVRISGAGNPGATVLLPWLRASVPNFGAGTVGECAAVFSGLSAAMQQEVLDDFWVDLSEECSEAIMSLRGLAPSLNWKIDSIRAWPFQLRWYFAGIVLLARQIDEDLKEAERQVSRAAAYSRHLMGDTPRAMAASLGCSAEQASRLLFEYFSAFSRKQLASMRPVKSREQQDQEKQVLSALQEGCSTKDIAQRAGCSQREVLAIVAADGQELLTVSQAKKRQEHLAMAERAFAIRKGEPNRWAIAAKLGCSFSILVGLLADGEFYGDPRTDKTRLKRAIQCRRPAARGLCIEEAAAVGKMTVAQLRQARKDRPILMDLHAEQFGQA